MLSDYLDPAYTADVVPLSGGRGRQKIARGGDEDPGDGYNPGGGYNPVLPDAAPPNPDAPAVAPSDEAPVLPSYPIDPYEPAPGYGPGSAYDPGAPYDPGPAPIFTPPDFTAPTIEQIQADPAYQFRLNQGLQAMQRSAAARGTLQTGGTLKDLMDYGQAAASQEYDNAYNRALKTWHDTEYAPAQDLFQSQYEPWALASGYGNQDWLAMNGWGNQDWLAGQGLDFSAYQAWLQAQLQEQGLLNSAVGNIING